MYFIYCVSLDELSNTSALILKIEKELGTSGRLLVRYSGTENKLRIMLEGKDEKIITAYAEESLQLNDTGQQHQAHLLLLFPDAFLELLYMYLDAHLLQY